MLHERSRALRVAYPALRGRQGLTAVSPCATDTYNSLKMPWNFFCTRLFFVPFLKIVFENRLLEHFPGFGVSRGTVGLGRGTPGRTTRTAQCVIGNQSASRFGLRCFGHGTIQRT